MVNVSQITSDLARLPDNALQRYAMMHKDDPYVLSLALSESNRRKEMRAGAQMQHQPQPRVTDQAVASMAPAPQIELPENVGIGALPARNMARMADGGIVGYGDSDGGMANDGQLMYNNEPVLRMAQGGALHFADRGAVRDSGGSLFDRALDAEGVKDPKERAFLKAIHMQESRGRESAPTSNRGAHGPMQILPKTFQSVADPGMDITNPMDNMRAGIRYARQGYEIAKGDPVLGGAYYYGGPGGYQKAVRSQAVSDPGNPQAPNTLQYGNSIAKRMFDLLPLGSARAEEVPRAAPAAAAPIGASAASQIPTGGPKAPEAVVENPGFFGRIGNAMGLSPDTQRNISNLNQALSGAMGATYLPNYLATGEGVMTRAASAGEKLAEKLGLTKTAGLTPAQIKAMQAENAGLASLKAAQEAQEAAAASGALPGEAQLAAKAAQASQAAAVPSKAEAIQAASLAREAADAQRVMQAGKVVQTLPKLTATGDAMPQGIETLASGPGYNPNAMAPVSPSEFGASEAPISPAADNKETAKALVETAKKEIPPEQRKGFSNEDLLELGLRLMGTKSPYLSQAISEAGLGTLASRREREKDEQAKGLREAQEAYYRGQDVYHRALANKAEVEAQIAQSGIKDTAAVMAAADKIFDNLMSGLSVMEKYNMTPEKRQQLYNQALAQAYGAFRMTPPAGLSTGPAPAQSDPLGILGKKG